MPQPLLKLTAIEKSYPGVKSLDRVDFEVRPGEIHALLGENGAGKSTLTRVIGGAAHPDAGSVEFDGRRVTWASPRQAREAGIHVIHQELALFPDLSVAENILIDHQPRNGLGLLDRRQRNRLAQASLDRLGVRIPVRATVGSLSVADQQMVEIAKALVGDLKLIIFDEPTAVISGREVDLLFDNMRRLRAAGVGIVYISHRLEEIFEVADRVTVLKDGKLVGTREIEAIDRDGLIRMMVGRQIADLYPPKRDGQPLGTPVLRAEHVASGTRVRDVSLSLHAGEILGVAGMVGSGRTELAHALFGTGPIDAGRVTVAGASSRPPDPRHSIRSGIGFLTEDRKGEGLFLQLSIAQNITAPILEQVTRGGLLDGRAEAELGRQEIAAFSIAAPSPAVRVVNLSGGNQQKVLISRWARIADKVLILDEPTRGVDVGAKLEIYRIIRQLADSGTAILLISSELPEVIGMSDRLIVMSQGRVTGELEGPAMTEENVMQLAVVTQTRTASAAGRRPS